MKKAFTMLELVFVIVVIGILAAAIIPSTRTNPLQEAAVQVLSHIRYTQHLAMMDDKYDATKANWYKERWQIIFRSNAGSDNLPAYTIFSDATGANPSLPHETEIAINPSNPSQRLTGGFTGIAKLDINDATFVGTSKLNLGRSYGIANFTFPNACNAGATTSRIAFDHLGRPIQGDLGANIQAYDGNDLIQADCDIMLTHSNGDTITIRIQEETGYACILDAAGICI